MPRRTSQQSNGDGMAPPAVWIVRTCTTSAEARFYEHYYLQFIPALAVREGCRVVEIPLPQHTADARARIYAPGVYVRRLLDIMAFFFLTKFTEKPLRFFGLLGSTFFAAGSVTTLVLLVQRLEGIGIANRPLLLLGVLLLALGVQLVGLGLVGEIIVYLRAPQRRSYQVRETT